MSHAQLKERELRAAAMLIVSTAKHGTYLHDCNDLLSIVALRQSQALERLVIAARLGLRDDKGMQRGSTLADIARAAAIERLCDRLSFGPVLCHACREIRCLSSI